MGKRFILFFQLILLVFSCQREDPLDNNDINGFGGPQKDYSYEDFGDFYNYNAFIDKINTNDNSGILIPPIALPGSRIAVVTENGYIHKIYEKNIEWSSKSMEVDFPVSSMVIDKQGNYYLLTSTGELASLDINGKLKWKIKVSEDSTENYTFSDLLISDNSLYLSDNKGKLYAYSIDGKLLWNKAFNLTINRTLSVSKSGKIALTLTNDEFGSNDILVFIDKTGQIIFERELKGIRLFRAPTIHNDKLILTGVEVINDQRSNLILCFDSLGNEIWRKKIDLFPRYSSVSRDGSILIVAYNSGIGEPFSVIYCLDQYGKEIWKLYYDVLIKTPILISKNKLAFIGLKENLTAVFFMKKDGSIINHISLNEAPSINIIPTVRSDGVICFAAVNKLEIIRIDDTFLNKLLPW